MARGLLPGLPKGAFGSPGGNNQASSGAGRLDAPRVDRQDGHSQSGTSEAMTLTVVPSLQVLTPSLKSLAAAASRVSCK
jgi:hypothetical protein